MDSFPITQIIDSIDDNKKMKISQGFLFKYNSKAYIISIHHFNSILVSIYDKKYLKPYKNITWNELQIFNYIDTINTQLIKNYSTTFLDFDDKVYININNRKEEFTNC